METTKATNTATTISAVDGHYPGFKKIKGLSFDISIVMSAPDLSAANSIQREIDASRLVTRWNAHNDLLTACDRALRHFESIRAEDREDTPLMACLRRAVAKGLGAT